MASVIGFSLDCEKESFLFAFAEEAEEAEKDIDEIQIEGECAEEGEFHITFVNRLFIEHELADLLGVIDREAGEDEYTDGRHPDALRATENHPDNRGDDESRQSKDKEGAQAAEVLLRKRTDDSQNGKRTGGDKENLRDAGDLIDEENRTERRSVHDAINRIHDGGYAKTHFLDKHTEADHQQ